MNIKILNVKTIEFTSNRKGGGGGDLLFPCILMILYPGIGPGFWNQANSDQAAKKPAEADQCWRVCACCRMAGSLYFIRSSRGIDIQTYNTDRHPLSRQINSH